MSLSTNTDGIINAVLGGLQGPAGPAGPAGPPGVSTGQVLFPFPTATGGPNPAPNDGAINLTISNTSESTINTTFTQNVPVRIGSFTTAANYPNVTTLLPDLWDLNVYATASAATGVYAFFNLYEVQTDNGNLEVLIAGLNTSPYTGGGVLISGTPSSSVQFYSYSLNVPTYAMYSANSLLRVKLYAVDTLATGRTATFYFGSTSASPYPTHIHSGLVAQGSGGVTINNPAQYRILTDTNASTINGEANLTFNGSTLSVAGGSTTVTSLQATGNSYLATAGGYVGIGNTNTTYNLDVTGTARVSGNTLVGGTLGVTGATTLAGLSAGSTSVSTLSTSGLATLASASVTGNETVGGTLNVTGATTLAGLSAGATSVSTLSTSGLATLASASVTGNETVGGTLNVTGATTLAGLSAGATSVSTLSTSGLATLASASVTGNETVGGTLNVTGNTTVGGTLGVTGATTLASASVTGNETVGGTLNVTGATTLAGLNASATSVSTLNTSGLATLASASVTGNEQVGGTLNVTGATTLAGLSAGATSVSTLSTSGLATLASASVTGNEQVGGTLNVTGATTLSTLSSSSTTSLATGSGIVTIGSAPPSQVYKFDINNGASTNMAQRIYGSSVDGALIRYENVASGGTIYHTGSTAPGSGAGAGFAIYDVTNSASRFLVSGVSGSLGYIGIGTTAPSYLLDVAGSINATNDSYFKTNVGSVFFIPLGTETGTNTTFIRNDGTYTYLMCGSRAGYNSLRPFTVTNSNGLVSMQQGLNIYGGCGINGGSTIDALNVTGNTNLATTSGSSVGIGTTTPSYLLDVAGKIRGAVPYNLLSPGAGTTTLTISNQNTYYYVTPSASGAIIALPAANTSGYMDGGFFTFRIPSTASYGATINGVVVSTGTTITFINLYIGGAPTWSQF